MRAGRLSFLLVFAVCLAAQGKPTTNDRFSRRIEHFLNVTEFETSFTNVFGAQMGKDPTMAAYQSKITEFMNKFFSFKSLKPQIVRIYRELYTLPEINGLIKFYSTPLGKKLLQKETQVQARLIELIQNRLQEQMPQMMVWFQQAFFEDSTNGTIPFF